MAKVLIPTPLRQFTGKQDSVTVAGASVREVAAGLECGITLDTNDIQVGDVIEAYTVQPKPR